MRGATLKRVLIDGYVFAAQAAPAFSVDVRTAFVGGPLIPGGFVVSVVIVLGSRLGRFFSYYWFEKHQRGPRAGPAPDVVNYSDPVRFPFSPGV